MTNMITPKSWAAFVARVILGLIFLAAGFWKVFFLGAVEHARDLFVVPYAVSFLPEWLLWIAGTTIPFVELVCGALMVAGWKRFPAALGLGGVLVGTSSSPTRCTHSIPTSSRASCCWCLRWRCSRKTT